MQQEELETNIEYPSLVTRIQSNFIDGVLLLGFMFIFASLVGDSEFMPGWTKALLFVLVWVLYEPLCAAYGVTLGNYLMGIRVRNVNDYSQKISLPYAFVRVFVKGFLGIYSFVSVHFNPRRRALHDLAAKSIMLEVPQTLK